MKPSIEKIISPLYLSVTIAILALCLRIHALMGRSLSGDEIFQFNNMAGPFKPFWGHCHYGDHSSFPGDYLLTYPFVALFQMNKWALAVPHIFVTIIGFYFLYKLCQQFYATVWGYVIAFLIVAFNANLVYHSFEFRPYAVLPTLVLANLYFSNKVLGQYQTLTTKQKILLGIYFFVSFNFHAYGVLIFILPVVYNILIRIKVPWKNLWHRPAIRYFLGVIAFAFPVWLWYAASSHFGLSPNPDFYGPKDVFIYIPNPIDNIIGFSKGVLGNLIGQKSLYFLLLGGMFPFLVPHHQRKIQILFFGLLVILPVGLILIVDIFSQYWFLQRQFVWVMPIFAFFTGWCWDSVIVYLKGR